MKKKLCRRRWALPLLTLLWIGFIWIHSLQNAEVSSGESARILVLIRRLLPGVTMHAVRKAAHFVEFWLLGLLLYLDFRAFGREGFLAPAAAGLGVAAVDELIQRFVPGRSGELSDVLLDLSGVVTACLLCLAVSRLRRKRKRGEPE